MDGWKDGCNRAIIVVTPVLFLQWQVKTSVVKKDYTGLYWPHYRFSRGEYFSCVQHGNCFISTSKMQTFLFVRLDLDVSKDIPLAKICSCSLLLSCHLSFDSSRVDSDLALFVVSECFRWIPFAMLSVRQADTVKDSQPTRCTVRRASM